jgi:hypothetical protein
VEVERSRSPPNKGAFIMLDDPEDGDDANGVRNKGKTNGKRIEKDDKKKKAEVVILTEKIERYEVKRKREREET